MRINLIFFLLLLLCPFTIDLYAQAKIQKANKPSWIRTLEHSPSDVDHQNIGLGYYYELLDKQVNLGTQEQFYQEVRVLIEDSGAENAGQIHISYDPSYQTLIIHELKVVRGKENLDKNHVSAFKLIATETDLSRFLYNGTYTAYHIVDDLRKGDKIILSYTLKGFNPVFEGKFFDSSNLQGYEQIGLVHLNYVVPKERKLQFKYHNGAEEPKQLITDAGASYYWEIAGTDMVEYEYYVPAWYTVLQWIECTEYGDWKAVGDWANRINPIVPLAQGTKLKTFTEDVWTQAKGNKREYLNRMTDFVQNEVRYMGIEVGEYSHRANHPNKIFEQRYGDCKDKSVLLVTVLRDRGIDASLVLANTYKDKGLDQVLPSPYAFNHMIVKAVLDGRSQFIDPTIPDQGGRIEHRYFPAYGQVLDLGSPARLADVQPDNEGLTWIKEMYQLHDDGSAVLSVETVYTGSNADDIRQFFKNTAKNSVQKQYLDYYQRMHANLKADGLLSYEDDMETNTFVVKEKYTIKKIYDVEDGTNKKYISFFSNHINEYLPQVNMVRDAPIAIPYPMRIEHDVYVINPNNKKAPAHHEAAHQQRESYFISKNIVGVQDTLKISHVLYFYNSYIDTEDVEAYVEDFSNRNIMFSSGFYVDDDGSLVENSFLSAGKVSWLAILFVLLIIAGGIVFIRRYIRSKPTNIIKVHDEMYHDQIGGWASLLGFTLVISTLRIIWETFSDNYFSTSIWDAHLYLDNVSEFSFKVLLASELLAHWVLLMGMCLSIYLFFKRRDIFPQTLFCLLLFRLLYSTINAVVSYEMLPDHLLEGQNIASDLIGMVVYCVVWSLYLYNSERVKGTFVLPYGAKNTKFTYDFEETDSEADDEISPEE